MSSLMPDANTKTSLIRNEANQFFWFGQTQMITVICIMLNIVQTKEIQLLP